MSDLLLDGPPQSRLRLVLAHGAGAGMDSPFMADFTALLVARDVHVARFEFPYMQRRREDGKRRPPDRQPKLEAHYEGVLGALPGAAGDWAIGGKSMGGRIASHVADRCGVRGLVCLGYPFHPPGKPERLRTAHLADLRTPTLILQGERDPFGTAEETVAYELSPSIRLEFLPDGDHGLKPRKSSGVTLHENLERAATELVSWLERLSVASG